MNRTTRLLILSIVLNTIIIGCSDDAKYKAMAEKYNAIQAEKAKHKAMSAEEMAAHSDEEMHHAMPMPIILIPMKSAAMRMIYRRR
jgi:nitrite reductase (NO-forming)